VPAQARPVVVHAIRAGFVTGLNEVLLIGAILVFASALLTLVLIRSRDFEVSAARSGAAPGQGGASPDEDRARSGDRAAPPDEPVQPAGAEAVQPVVEAATGNGAGESDGSLVGEGNGTGDGSLAGEPQPGSQPGR